MKVVLTNEARRDLESIGDHIAQDNPRRAQSFVAELIHKARSLADLPKRFPLVPRYEHLGVRPRAYGNYLIFYRVESDRVSILHILHGARDYEAFLFPDESSTRLRYCTIAPAAGRLSATSGATFVTIASIPA